jgi:hypothetical protein
MTEGFSDNIFLTQGNEKSDFVTKFSPALNLDFALAPRNIITLGYDGDYLFHNNYDNFKKDHHGGSATWRLQTQKGSFFEINTTVKESAIQPYDERSKYKEYKRWEGACNNSLQLSDATEIGLKYEHTSRRFDKSIYQFDDYDQDSVSLNSVFEGVSIFPILLEYRYDRQNNEDPVGPSTDFNSHTIFLGARWRESSRLSGDLRLGYTTATFEEADNFSGFATDTELSYRFSEITIFKLNLSRYVSETTLTARDTGTYFVSTGAGFRVIHHRWEPLKVTLNLDYTNRNYEQQYFEQNRQDDEYIAGLGAQYTFHEPFSLTIKYQFRSNDSNYPLVDYQENHIEAGITVSY